LNDLKEESVRGFLLEIKSTITKPPGNWRSWVLVPRKENLNCISELGFTFQDVRDVVLDLSVTDYCEGPLQDQDKIGAFWIFGKVISGQEIYIKLKLASLSSLKIVRIVSFHKADRPLCYPYSQKKID